MSPGSNFIIEQYGNIFHLSSVCLMLPDKSQVTPSDANKISVIQSVISWFQSWELFCPVTWPIF